ncbi:hypothetical protein V6N11_032128 [Hibiscus sabdariffa]|uniref:Uncharacterized protein n=1 Tax=Hibiscus sabdariffa TaxID=183260 RepID=A0ABR2T0F8_9ROSI
MSIHGLFLKEALSPGFGRREVPIVDVLDDLEDDPLSVAATARLKVFTHFFWGLGNKDTVRALKNATFNHRADIVFLSEMKQKKRYLEKIRMKMKFDNAFYIEPEGIAGGLAYGGQMKLSYLYFIMTRTLLTLKYQLVENPNGDFNVVACLEEKYGGAPFD